MPPDEGVEEKPPDEGVEEKPPRQRGDRGVAPLTKAFSTAPRSEDLFADRRGGITRMGGECAAGISLEGLFQLPLKVGVNI